MRELLAQGNKSEGTFAKYDSMTLKIGVRKILYNKIFQRASRVNFTFGEYQTAMVANGAMQ